MHLIWIAVLILGAVGLISALVLFVASRKFAVEEDPLSGLLGLCRCLCQGGRCRKSGWYALSRRRTAGDGARSFYFGHVGDSRCA